jgi:hypothetical protein
VREKEIKKVNEKKEKTKMMDFDWPFNELL